MRLAVVFLAVAGVLLAGCPRGMDADAGFPVDGGVTACLDRPTDPQQPPGRQLPCEMLPPGFGK